MRGIQIGYGNVVKDRFEMMFRKTKELTDLLEKHGNRRSLKIIKRKMKRAAARPKDLEDLKYLRRLKRG